MNTVHVLPTAPGPSSNDEIVSFPATETLYRFLITLLFPSTHADLVV